MSSTKITVTLKLETEVDLSTYSDPDANDYPYDEQIQDEIANSLAHGDSVWSEELSNATVVVVIND